MNGDLTAFGHGWELDKYKEMWDKGPGNQDLSWAGQP